MNINQDNQAIIEEIRANLAGILADLAHAKAACDRIINYRSPRVSVAPIVIDKHPDVHKVPLIDYCEEEEISIVYIDRGYQLAANSMSKVLTVEEEVVDDSFNEALFTAELSQMCLIPEAFRGVHRNKVMSSVGNGCKIYKTSISSVFQNSHMVGNKWKFSLQDKSVVGFVLGSVMLPECFDPGIIQALLWISEGGLLVDEKQAVLTIVGGKSIPIKHFVTNQVLHGIDELLAADHWLMLYGKPYFPVNCQLSNLFALKKLTKNTISSIWHHNSVISFLPSHTDYAYYSAVARVTRTLSEDQHYTSEILSVRYNYIVYKSSMKYYIFSSVYSNQLISEFYSYNHLHILDEVPTIHGVTESVVISAQVLCVIHNGQVALGNSVLTMEPAAKNEFVANLEVSIAWDFLSADRTNDMIQLFQLRGESGLKTTIVSSKLSSSLLEGSGRYSVAIEFTSTELYDRETGSWFTIVILSTILRTMDGGKDSSTFSMCFTNDVAIRFWDVLILLSLNTLWIIGLSNPNTQLGDDTHSDNHGVEFIDQLSTTRVIMQLQNLRLWDMVVYQFQSFFSVLVAED